MNKRPLSVSIIGCLSVAAGAVGIAYHLTELKGQLDYGVVWLCLVRLVAILCGVFVLRGSNWARWLLLVWIAYHAVLSAFHTRSGFLTHSLLFAVVAYFLLRAPASAYFRNVKSKHEQLPKTGDAPVT